MNIPSNQDKDVRDYHHSHAEDASDDEKDGHDRHHEHAADPGAQNAHPAQRGKQAGDPYVVHVNNKGMTEKHAGSGSMASDATSDSSRDEQN